MYFFLLEFRSLSILIIKELNKKKYWKLRRRIVWENNNNNKISIFVVISVITITTKDTPHFRNYNNITSNVLVAYLLKKTYF